jgi:hypothetical protein
MEQKANESRANSALFHRGLKSWRTVIGGVDRCPNCSIGPSLPQRFWGDALAGRLHCNRASEKPCLLYIGRIGMVLGHMNKRSGWLGGLLPFS